MKKIIAILLVTVLLLLSLTGCTLESMRKTHLKFDENGNISFGGATYIYLQDDRNVLNPELDYEVRYYTTDADVPLLLQDSFGASTYLSKDGRFLQIWGYEIYCRSDVYEQISSMVQNPDELEYYGFYDMNRDFVRMNKEDSAWLRSILEQLEPLTEKLYESDMEYMTKLEACNEDLLLREHVYTIYKTEVGFLFKAYNITSGSYEYLPFPEFQTARLAQIIGTYGEFWR